MMNLKVVKVERVLEGLEMELNVYNKYVKEHLLNNLDRNELGGERGEVSRHMSVRRFANFSQNNTVVTVLIRTPELAFVEVTTDKRCTGSDFSRRTIKTVSNYIEIPEYDVTMSNNDLHIAAAKFALNELEVFDTRINKVTMFHKEINDVVGIAAVATVAVGLYKGFKFLAKKMK